MFSYLIIDQWSVILPLISIISDFLLIKWTLSSVRLLPWLAKRWYRAAVNFVMSHIELGYARHHKIDVHSWSSRLWDTHDSEVRDADAVNHDHLIVFASKFEAFRYRLTKTWRGRRSSAEARPGLVAHGTPCSARRIQKGALATEKNVNCEAHTLSLKVFLS